MTLDFMFCLFGLTKLPFENGFYYCLEGLLKQIQASKPPDLRFASRVCQEADQKRNPHMAASAQSEQQLPVLLLGVLKKSHVLPIWSVKQAHALPSWSV